MSENARRSARQRKANPKYASQGWDKETLRLLRESDSSGSNSSASEDDTDLGGSVDEINSPTRSNLPDDDFRRHIRSGSASSASSSSATRSNVIDSDGSTHPTPEPDEPMEDVEALSGSGGEQETEVTEIHSRGLQTFRNRGGPRSGIQAHIFGPDIDSLYPILEARDTWLVGSDITFPSRYNLCDWIGRVDRARQFPEVSGLVYDLMGDASDLPALSALLAIQIQTPLNSDLRNLYLPFSASNTPSHTIVTGPSNRQSSHILNPYQTLELEAGFEMDDPYGQTQDSPDRGGQDSDVEKNNQSPNERSSAQPDSTANEETTKVRQGWFLNVGEKISALAWHPNSHGSQLLAVATRSTKAQRETVPLTVETGPPAFSRSTPYPAAIQLWRLVTHEGSEPQLRRMEMSSHPAMVQAICVNHGDVRQLEWWAIEERQVPHDGPGTDQDYFEGRLAALFSDGSLRIYCVRCPVKGLGPELEYVLIENPAMTITPPPDTIFTTFSFMSKRDIVVGTAAGTACIYDLAILGSKGEITEPTLVYECHNTYTMSICSGRLSGLPYIIISASASGEVVLMDLRAPDQDVLRLHKARLPSRNLVYAPFTRSILITTNKSGNTEARSSASTVLMAHSLRHFYIANAIAYLPELNGSGTALAASKWHPCILVGNARGAVFATNYVRRLVPTGRSAQITSPDGWLQKLCDYDWIPQQDSSASDLNSWTGSDLYHGRDVRPGMSRFQEGFKPEKINIGRDNTKRKKKKVNDDVGAEVIFEEEQAVSAMEWNPNSHCAGFVAIGWASGILRIQDVAHDVQ